MGKRVRADTAASADLPLRLLAGTALSAAVLSLALAGAGALSEAQERGWASAALQELGVAARGALDRPGSVREVALTPSQGLGASELVVESGPGGGLVAHVAAGRAQLGASALCGSCALRNGTLRSFSLPAALHLSCDRPGELRIEAVL